MMRQLIVVFTLGLLACGAIAGSWKVMKGDKACLLADMNLTLEVDYTTSSDSSKIAKFDLPSDATVDTSSQCGDSSSNIMLNFFEGYSIMFEFAVMDTTYELQKVELKYKEDENRFPDAKVPGQDYDIPGDVSLFITPLGDSYRCNSDVIDISLTGVTLTFSDVKLQPFNVTDGKFSEEHVCTADLSNKTTASPTTTSPTTVAPNTTAPTTPMMTNWTTEILTTEILTTVVLTTESNSTTAIQTTVQPITTAPPKPTEGNWTVKDDKNSTCMNMAFNANFSISYTDEDNKTAIMKAVLPVDADPSNSICMQNTSLFILVFNDTWSLVMVFEKTNNSKYGKSSGKFNAFEMMEIGLQYVDPLHQNGEAEGNGSYFLTNLNKTYMCNADSVITVENVNITFTDVKLQPFANGHEYPGELEDCKQDDKSSNIVPIAVGCALAGLVVIVLIAYLIGRKRTKSVGYQTV